MSTCTISGTDEMTLEQWQILNTKPLLTVEEACVFFGVGRNRMDSILRTEDADSFKLSVGNRRRVKKDKFREYLDGAKAI